MTTPEPEAPAEAAAPGYPVYPDRCPTCQTLTANNVVVITDPQTAERTVRCCTPGCPQTWGE